MRITEVMYGRTVSYGDYCNERCEARVELGPEDIPEVAARMARLHVLDALMASANERQEREAERVRAEEEEARRRANERRQRFEQRLLAAGVTEQQIASHGERAWDHYELYGNFAYTLNELRSGGLDHVADAVDRQKEPF